MQTDAHTADLTDEHTTGIQKSEQDESNPRAHHATFFTILGIMLISFISVLDQTVIGTAIPRIAADLKGFDQITWVTTIYLLTSTVTVPIYGKLSDLYGRKPIFLFGIVVFLGGSALSGTAQSMLQLVLYRALQGIGSGGLQPIAAAIIGDLFPPRERGKWQGLFGSTYALAVIVGPVVGGFLTDHFSWRWVFYVNLPMGVATLFVLIFLMPVLRPDQQHASIDYVGVGLLILGTLPLLLGLSWAGSQYAWLSPQILGLLGSAILMLTLLTLHSAHQERHGKQPVIEPGLFRAQPRIFNVSLLATMSAAVALMGSSYFIPLYIQSVTGVSATNSGLTMMPMMLTAIAGSSVTGLLISLIGRYKWIALAGTVVSMSGVLLLLRLTAHSNITEVIIGIMVLGLGLGSSMSVYTVIVQNALPNKIGQVTAMLTYFRQIGQSIGLAAMGSIVTASYNTNFSNNLPSQFSQTLPPQVIRTFQNPLVLLSQETMTHLRASLLRSGTQTGTAFDGLLNFIKVTLTQSIHNAFVLSFAMMVLVCVVVCFLKEIPLASRKELHGTVTKTEQG
jgi:EmrB/QacA subfamily drug resistance transporter